MAITGTGTQADPFVVHSYDEFMTLSDSGHSGSANIYIKWFDNPNQVLDCNTYGSEFKWGQFDNGSNGGNARYIIDIDLNGATIKNFFIDDGKAMFNSISRGGDTGSLGIINVRNGFLRNIFLGSSTSKLSNGAVNFYDVSISANISGSNDEFIDGFWNGSIDDFLTHIDNCAFYLVASTLNYSIMANPRMTDTDIELHVSNLNGKVPFRGDRNDRPCYLTDCRITGKLSGDVHTSNYSVQTPLGSASSYNGGDNELCQFTNCVIDLDLTDSTVGSYHNVNYNIVNASGSTKMNTNVICKSHYPSIGTQQGLEYPTVWNYMAHEDIRNGTYLNNAGFTVVEVVAGS